MNRLLRLMISMTFLLVCQSVTAQLLTEEARQQLRRGNEFYEQEKYVEAEVSYRKAEESKAGQLASSFNLGNALYQQQRYQEAAAQFGRAASLAEEKSLQAQAYHNLGNAHLRQALQNSAKQDPSQALQQSIGAYKQALRRNPQDEETRYNLAYALRMLQQEQQQNQQDQQDQDQQEQDQDQDQDQQDQQEQDESQDQEGQQDQQQPADQDQEQEQQQQQERQMTPEEIEDMLEALRYQEQKLREDMQRDKSKAKQRKVQKDW